MNLIDAWYEMYKDKYESSDKAIKHLNMVCDKHLRLSEFIAYKNKKRLPKDCIQWLMRCDIMIDSLKKAGWKNVELELSAENLIELVNVMSLPRTRK